MKNRSKIKLGAGLAVFMATVLWGVNYVAQSKAAGHIDPFNFNGIRMIMGFFTLLPLILIRNKKKTGRYQVFGPDDNKKLTIKGGAVAGFFLLAGISTQQIGIAYTSVGKAGFLSSLFVVMIPLIGLVQGYKVRAYQWLGIGTALVGIWFLSVSEDFSINKGDLILILTAFLIALHVVTTGHYNRQVDTFQFTLVRFMVGALICFFIVVGFEGLDLSGLREIWPWALYAGIFGSGMAFTLTALGQRHLDNISVSLIMSLESVFAALSGYLILGQALSSREILGCILVFLAVLGMNLYGEILVMRDKKSKEENN